MSQNKRLPFSKKNYVLLITGVVLNIVGFYIMSSDTEPYGFGFKGITLGPIIVMIGFLVQFLTILLPNNNKTSNDESK